VPVSRPVPVPVPHPVAVPKPVPVYVNTPSVVSASLGGFGNALSPGTGLGQGISGGLGYGGGLPGSIVGAPWSGISGGGLSSGAGPSDNGHGGWGWR
jgi:hypothetical protein